MAVAVCCFLAGRFFVIALLAMGYSAMRLFLFRARSFLRVSLQVKRMRTTRHNRSLMPMSIVNNTGNQ